jgi:hypothetical protein
MNSVEHDTNYLDYLPRGNWFTISGAFNNPAADYALTDDSSVTRTWTQQSDAQRATMLMAFIHYGLQVLGSENPNDYVRCTARRFVELYNQGLLDFYVGADTQACLRWDFEVASEHLAGFVPSPDAPVYLPRQYGGRLVVFAPAWLQTAVTRPLQALTYLLRAASFARDDYFGLFEGVQYVGMRGMGIAEVPNRIVCERRAQALMSELLNQALENDQLIFHIPPRINSDLYTIRDRVPRAACSLSLMYRDPASPPPSDAGE